MYEFVNYLNYLNKEIYNKIIQQKLHVMQFTVCKTKNMISVVSGHYRWLLQNICCING